MPDLQGPPAHDIQNIFTSVAHGYDRANGVMTFGLAHSWRQKLVRWSGAKPGDAVLDCATGTGDLAFEFKRVVGPTGRVVGTDFCAAMLDLAPAKSHRLDLEVDFHAADVMQLPFEDQSFDICSIAYGIRNVENPVQALSEMARVTRPGGCVMVLETGHARLPVIAKGLEVYFRHVVPLVGGWITGRREAYEYLNQSSMRFPSAEDFIKVMKATRRFRQTEYKSLMGGASYVYKGIV